MPKKRNPRVDEAVKEAVAALLEAEIADPRVAFATVTDARVSEDRRYATVYYTTLDPNMVTRPARRVGADAVPEPHDVAEGLASAAPRIQALLGRRLRMRHTPTITFAPDLAAERGRRVEQLLREVRASEEHAAPVDEQE